MKRRGKRMSKAAACPAIEHRIGPARLGADLGGHLEVVLRGQRRGHKAGVDDADAEALRVQVEVEHLGQMRECCLAGPIGQGSGQTARQQRCWR